MSSTEDTSVEAQQNSTTKEEEKPLTAEQKLRIEQNRQKALLLKRKNQENSQTKNVKSSNLGICSQAPKLIDTGGGFLLEESDLLEEKKKVSEVLDKIRIVEKPPPILPPDQPECLECKKDFSGSYLLEKFNYPVCDNCRDNEDKHALITKTEAKKNYLLTDADLEQRGEPLKFLLGKNPHNSRWSDMKLYLLVQVEKRALEIWGSEEKLVEELEKKEEKRAKTKHKAHQKRMKDLRMQVRSSLFTRAVGENHKHQFGEEVYNESNDEYSRTCVTCDFTETYEKM